MRSIKLKTFVAWYLRNIHNLDTFEAKACITDGAGDKQIDAVYIDDQSSTIYIIQGKFYKGDTVDAEPLREVTSSWIQIKNVDQDNLIAIEMKKSNAPSAEKQKDRERLIALTKDSFDDVWAWDHNLPEHVCRYVLGVYYEINYRQKEIHIEYYRRGELVRSYSNHFVG